MAFPCRDGGLSLVVAIGDGLCARCLRHSPYLSLVPSSARERVLYVL